MRVAGVVRRIALGLGVLASVGLVGCSNSPTPRQAAPASGHSASSLAAALSSTASPSPSSAPSVSATPTGARGITNLLVTSTVRSQLAAAYAAGKGIPVSDIAGTVAGSVYYAVDTAQDTYWALAIFEPSPRAPLTVQIGFQDGAELGMFTKVGPGNWRVKIDHEPDICGEIIYFPRPVLTIWSLPIRSTGPVCSTGNSPSPAVASAGH